MPKKIKAKTVEKTNHRKNLVKLIEKAAYRYNKHTVWNDFVYMSAAALSQPIDYRQEREDKFMRIKKSYDEETYKLFQEMLVELTMAFETEGFYDILGETYTMMDLIDKRNGQFFTPYTVCRFMSATQGTGESLSAEIRQKGFLKVGDMCCGAGAMLIAFADHCASCGVDYQASVLFVAQDIDPAVARMCYLQMSLLGMPGYVMIGNSLDYSTPEESNIWYTPMYALQGFSFRTQNDGGILMNLDIENQDCLICAIYYQSDRFKPSDF